MSNYVKGYFFADDEKVVSAVVESIRQNSVIGFHIVPLTQIPDVKGFPKSDDRVYFYLSDHKDTLLAGELILELDWSEHYQSPLPMKLVNRIALVVKAIEIIADVSHSRVVGLWLSEVDQLEGTAQLPLESLFETISADFDRVGIPCILYEVVP